MRVAVYVRVSTSLQEINGHSIPEQKERTKKYCEAMGWTIYKVYTDAGFTGANTERPALQRMLKDVKAGKINKVVVYKLDRLSRSQLDTLDLIENSFLAYNCDFISMSENFDTSTPFGRAMIGILAVFAQLEREQIKERMAMGREARAKQGKFHGSATVPIGYDYIDGELVVNEFEAMQVRKAHELYLTGMGIQAICDYFNENGYTHKHGKWWALTLRNVLGKKTYLGYSYWQGKWYNGSHEPILDKDIFDKVVKLKESKHETFLKHNRRDGMASSYLGGFLYCGCCGAKYVKDNHYSTHNKERYAIPVYKCSSRAKKKKSEIIDPDCKNKIWKMQELDCMILGEIQKLKLEPTTIKHEDTSKSVAKEIENLENQRDKLLDLYSIDQIPLNALQNKITALTDKIDRLKQEPEIDAKLSNEEAMQYVSSLGIIIERGDLAEIRAMVGALIDRIVLNGDDITIYWNFD